MGGVAERISVFLADDSVLIREGVRALLGREADLEVVGVAEDYDGLVAGAEAANPQVVVSDIRMPPNFQDEGIAACREIRKRHPGTGIVILSQYDDPDYAIKLLSEGQAGYGYLLKDRIAEGSALADAVRVVATGGSAIDPSIVDAMVSPATHGTDLTPEEETLLGFVAQGKPIKAIATTEGTTPAAVAERVQKLFLRLAEGASAGAEGALRRLRVLHEAIVEREEQGDSLARLLPSGVAARLRGSGREIGQTERLVVTVLMSDVRGYSAIAEHSDLSRLAAQLNTHRAEMNRAILEVGGTVMQYVGDAVMAVFGAPEPYGDHADRALAAAIGMHAAQARVNEEWAVADLPSFGIGIGLSTGEVAAAFLGSPERLEYTVVGDIVNLSQRLQDLARPAGTTVLAQATFASLSQPPGDAQAMEPTLVKGRDTPVLSYVIRA